MSEVIIEIIPLTAEQEAERARIGALAGAKELEIYETLRREAYQREADPLNFKWQETQLESDRIAWLEKKNEIKARYSYPVI